MFVVLVKTTVKFLLSRDEIYIGDSRTPDDGKLSSADNGPKVFRQEAQQPKF
jgi:hypothetical protein